MRKLTFPFVPPDPFLFWEATHRSPVRGFFLGSGLNSKEDHVIYCSTREPTRYWNASPPRSPNPLLHIKSWLKKNKTNEPRPRFVGILGFEAGRYFDKGISDLPRRPNPLRFPAIGIGEFDSVVKIDLRLGQTIIYSDRPPELERVSHILNRVESKERSRKYRYPRDFLGSPPAPFKVPSQAHFSSMVEKAKVFISQGDIYQANLSLRFMGSFSISPRILYQSMNKTNPSPFACLINWGPHCIVSCSPELLLKVEKGKIFTRPIAGTRPRGSNQKVDRIRKGQLLLSPKERAEHIMLVDLERNDLGRVARPGSVKVTERFSIERYSHVMHIVSQVEAELAAGRTSVDALEAVFPGGTITGCPKIRSIEVIEKLEKVSRGPFYGSAGYICDNGDAQFNLLIRSALVYKKKAYIQAGAGIVADSHPKREYRELKAKAQILLESIRKAQRGIPRTPKYSSPRKGGG